MDRLNWDDTRIFLALAREGTLSGAARRLLIGVATISRRIERMERALGVPLFLRHQHGYDLTDQGAAMLPRAEAVELAFEGVRHEAGAQSQIQGQVRLASVESVVAPFLVPALVPLLAENPGLDVEILFSTATVNMNRHDADLAVRMIRQLATMGFGLYGPADGSRPARHVVWPEAAGLAISLAWSAAFYAPDAPRFALNTLRGQIAAVQRGVGVAVLPHFLAREAGLRLLAARMPDGDLMQRPVFLVSHEDLAASRRVLAVAEAVAQEITARRRELSDA